MTNQEIYELIRRSKTLKAKVPKVVLLHAKMPARGFGEMHQFAKITDTQAFEIQHMYANHHERICDLARQFNLSYGYTAKVAKRQVRDML